MIREPMLSEEQWAKIAPLLPVLSSRGRPWKDTRAVFEGILWVLRSGARWKDLPEEFPSPATCWRRLRKWEEDGTWLRAWRAPLACPAKKGQLDGGEGSIDARFSPAKKGGPGSAH